MKFGLIGEKLSHSLSPEIHKKIFENLKISGDYSLIELKESEILDFFRDRSMEYRGFNVTIPYKVKLMDFMEEISDEAREIGAINTIFQKNGKFYGYNTDYFGYKRTLEENNIDIKDKDITILGAGGASRAVLKYSFDEGVKNILIVARNIEKAKKELDSLLKNRDNIEFLNFEEFEKRKEKGYLIVNCTPVGMFPNILNSPVSKESLENYENLVDLIYNPKETLFLKYGKELGKKSVNGLFMLVAQAVASQEIWQDKKIGNSVVKNIVSDLEEKF